MTRPHLVTHTRGLRYKNRHTELKVYGVMLIGGAFNATTAKPGKSTDRCIGHYST